MNILTGLPILGALLGKVFDRVLPDTARINEAQARVNEAELAGAGPSRLRLWRGFVGWILGLCLAWEILLRPVLVTYWPEVTLPPSMLKEVLTLLLGMMGMA